jgi:hypothetical protein
MPFNQARNMSKPRGGSGQQDGAALCRKSAYPATFSVASITTPNTRRGAGRGALAWNLNTRKDFFSEEKKQKTFTP